MQELSADCFNCWHCCNVLLTERSWNQNRCWKIPLPSKKVPGNCFWEASWRPNPDSQENILGDQAQFHQPLVFWMQSCSSMVQRLTWGIKSLTHRHDAKTGWTRQVNKYRDSNTCLTCRISRPQADTISSPRLSRRATSRASQQKTFRSKVDTWTGLEKSDHQNWAPPNRTKQSLARLLWEKKLILSVRRH